jgi:hypothetical protein
MAWGLGIAFTQKSEIHTNLAIIKTVVKSDTIQQTKMVAFLAANGVKKDSVYTIDLKNEKLGNVRLTFLETSWSNAYTMLKKGKVSMILEDKVNDTKYYFDPANAEAKTAFELVSSLYENGPAYYTSKQSVIEPLTMTGTRYADFFIP